MCGIAGHWSTKGKFDTAQLSRGVTSMCQTIQHRGPDGHGIYADAEVSIVLGHQRLSILDLEAGDQPMSDIDSDFWLVFNGEIYNYRELRRTLQAKGYRFRTQSDTETIIYAYREWGENCVEHFQGMFAFALWDKPRDVLFCARDRIGIKPFYYYWSAGEFVFCSELKGIVANANIELELEHSVLGEFLRGGYIASEQTSVARTHRLPPAHILIIENGHCRIKRYWSLATASRGIAPLSFGEASEELRHLLSQAVDEQLVSDVPIGAFLSGGVDSSAIVSLMSQSMSQDVLTHCVGFNSPNMDERKYATEVAKIAGTDHRDFLVEIDVGSALDNIIWHMDEPFADSSAIPTYYLCEAAKQRVTVCLSGDGGDELFAGYNWYEQLARLSRFDQATPQWARTGILNLFSGVPYQYSGAAFLKNIGSLPSTRHQNLTSRFTAPHLNKLLVDGVCEVVQSTHHPLEDSYAAMPSGWDAVKSAQLADMQSYLVEGILMKVDKMSMAHSLEVRVPMLDHRVVEFAFSQPTNYKLHAKNRKMLLKASISKSIPPSVLNRKKQGFSVPLREWLLGDLKERVGDLLLSSNRSHSGIFKTVEVNKLWRKFVRQGCHIDLSHHVWTLLCYEMWHQQYGRRLKNIE